MLLFMGDPDRHESPVLRINELCMWFLFLIINVSFLRFHSVLFKLFILMFWNNDQSSISSNHKNERELEYKNLLC